MTFHSIPRANRPSGRGSILRAAAFCLPFLLLCPLLLLGACATSGGPNSLEADRARRDLDRAEQQRRSGDLTAAIASYDAFLGSPECAPTVERIQAYLGRSDCRLQRGEPTSGRIDAELALASLRGDDVPDTTRRELERTAQTRLGDSELAQHRTTPARKHFRRALELSLSPRDRDLVTYRLYLCSAQEGSTSAGSLLSRLAQRDRPEFATLNRRFGAPASPTLTPVSAPAAPPRGALAELGALPRRQWRAHKAKSNKDAMTAIRRITVHHSGFKVNGTSEGSAANTVRSIQRDHQSSRGWADIGYHFLIDRAGRLWEGRELKYQGAHAGNNALNRGNVGICFLGDYRSQDVTAAQQRKLFEVLDWLRRKYDIPRARVEGHREVKGGTLCPGVRLERVVEAYRKGLSPVAMASP